MTMTKNTKPYRKYLLLGIRSGMTDRGLLEAHWFGINRDHKPIQFTAKELAEFRAEQNKRYRTDLN
jgi:hypothetical protein